MTWEEKAREERKRAAARAEEWTQNLADIRSKTTEDGIPLLDAGLIQDIQAWGPEEAEWVASLAAMTREELKKLNEFWRERNAGRWTVSEEPGKSITTTGRDHMETYNGGIKRMEMTALELCFVQFRATQEQELKRKLGDILIALINEEYGKLKSLDMLPTKR